MAGFENGRLQTAARAVGVMQAAYEAALDYAAATARSSASRSLDYQLTRAKLGRMAVLIQAGRQFAYDVATLMAKGEGAMEAVDGQGLRLQGGRVGHPRGDADPRRHGLRRGVPGQPLFVDARVLSIFEGADETLCLKVIARQLIAANQAA